MGRPQGWHTAARCESPGIGPLRGGGGALLAFTLSLDDFVITSFTSGARFNTLPVRVFGLMNKGVLPIINTLSSLMLALSLTHIYISVTLLKEEDEGRFDLGL